MEKQTEFKNLEEVYANTLTNRDVFIRDKNDNVIYCGDIRGLIFLGSPISKKKIIFYLDCKTMIDIKVDLEIR